MRDEATQTEETVRSFIERHSLLTDEGPLVVAVSGGADSVCLLGILHSLCGAGRRWPGVSLVVAHLNHRLRGAAASEDAQWVARLAADLGIPCHTGERDVAALARESGHGIEDAGRRARYAFLRDVAREVGASRICTGHTRDDQVETLLMQWLRGSALSGLTGMRPLVGDVARPLLPLTRAQTHAYCAARGWRPREDPSNQDRRYWRNRVRHDLLPMLERENPNLRETLIRNAELLAADERYLDDRADESWRTIVQAASPGTLALDRAALKGLPAALRHRVFRRAAAILTAGEPRLEARHIRLLDDFVLRTDAGRALHLPGGVIASLGPNDLSFTSRALPAQSAPEPAAPTPIHLPVPGCVAVSGTDWRICAELLDPAAGAPPPGADTPSCGEHSAGSAALRPAAGTAAAVGRPELRAYLDADAVDGPLIVRTWRPRDRFQPLGMSNEKKVHDYFVDAKVPRDDRGHIPLVFGPRHLLWIAGYRLDHRVRIVPTTRRVLALRIEPIPRPEQTPTNRDSEHC